MNTTKTCLSILAGSLLVSTAAIADQITTTGDFAADIDWAGCIAAAEADVSADGAAALAEALSAIGMSGTGIAAMEVTRQGNNGTVKNIDLGAALLSASLSFTEADAAAGAEAGSYFDFSFGPFDLTLPLGGAGAVGGATSESLGGFLASTLQYVTVSGKNIDELWSGLYLGTLQFNVSEAAVGELAGALGTSIEINCSLFGGCDTDISGGAAYAIGAALARAIAAGRVDVVTLAHYKDNNGPGSIVDDVDVWTGARARVSCDASAAAGAAADSID